MHGVRYKQWKMYFPHSYRTLNGRPGGDNGLPVEYEYNTMNEIELYDLSVDISETKNVAMQNPEVVEEIKILANKMRSELGDALYEINGKGNRTCGMVKD
ncbi:hypothetical protein J1N11_19170 [Marinilabiliaceae bacterium N1Y90]|nr:hypothetical protein [Marinilabiliaceae bacterium N1Y90]